jgi:hypothetical protein
MTFSCIRLAYKSSIILGDKLNLSEVNGAQPGGALGYAQSSTRQCCARRRQRGKPSRWPAVEGYRVGLDRFGGAIMQRTLIAVFDNRGDAQSAFDALEAAGFTRGQVRLSEGDPTGRPSGNIGHGHGSTGASTGGTGVLDSIRNFFGTMFGTDDSEHVQKYSDAVTRGHHVLTLTASAEPDLERAADIVERFGPVDIDEKAADWSGGALASEAMRSGADAQQRSASMSQQSAQGTQATSQGSMQGSPGPGSQQFGAGDASSAGSAGVPAGQRAGVRVVEHLPEATLNETEAAIEADEEYYLGHYNTTYAADGDQYDDYAPAYRYGSDMANNETYRGRAWKDVEPQLRTDWEGRNPGSAWAKIKDAVRHGWERITR